MRLKTNNRILGAALLLAIIFLIGAPVAAKIQDDDLLELARKNPLTLLNPDVIDSVKVSHDWMKRQQQMTAAYLENQLNELADRRNQLLAQTKSCLLYTSPSPRDRTRSRMPSSA